MTSVVLIFVGQVKCATREANETLCLTVAERCALRCASIIGGFFVAVNWFIKVRTGGCA